MKNKRIAIMQPGYIPWLGFFELMDKADLFVYLDDVQYTIRDWRNRNRIRTAQGWQWLSIPVLHKSRREQLLKDALINNQIDWRGSHLRALEINYSKASFFSNNFSVITQILLKHWENLTDLNITMIEVIRELLGIKTPTIRASMLNNIKTGKTQRIISICKQLQANYLYDSAAAASFIDIDLFAKEGIVVEFQNYKHPEYKQVYKPFIPYMSVLDLLFNCGRESLQNISNRKK
ncbi:MAG: WbqC family protein [Candidatus Omnitrophota bacterium]